MFKLLEIPSSLGAPDIYCGMENGPRSLTKLLNCDSISITIPPPAKDSGAIKNLSSLLKLNTSIKERVNKILAIDHKPLVLMGDCSSSIGVIYALLEKYENIGVIWFDAHGDFNTPEISPSGCLYGMGLAHIAGYGDRSILALSNKYIDTNNIIMIGQRDLDKAESALITESAITVYPKITNVLKKRLNILKNNGLNYVYLHFDFDVIDSIFNPAVLSPTHGGLTPDKLLDICEYLKNHFNILGIGISNYIPEKDVNGVFSKYVVQLINKMTAI